jgi:hypothetical protein
MLRVSALIAAAFQLTASSRVQYSPNAIGSIGCVQVTTAAEPAGRPSPAAKRVPRTYRACAAVSSWEMFYKNLKVQPSLQEY